MNNTNGLSETLELVRKLDIRLYSFGEGSYSLIQAPLLEFKRNKGGANGLSEKDEVSARRLGQSLQVICAEVFLEKYGSNLFDLFIESVSKSKLSSIKLTGFCAERLAAFSDILAENNNGRLIQEELDLVCNRYENPGSISERQKSFVIEYLEKELLDL